MKEQRLLLLDSDEKNIAKKKTFYICWEHQEQT